MAVGESRIAQPETERVKRIAPEVTVSTILHRVVFKGRELVNTLVEGHWQTTGWVVHAGQCLGNGASTFFSRVPSVEYRVGMLRCPVHRKSAAVHEHDDEGLARLGHGFEQCFFFCGQIEAGAISTLEPGDIHLHLLTLELRGDPHNRDHSVSLLGSGDCVCDRIGKRSQPDELDARSALAVFNLQRVPAPFFQLQSGCRGLGIVQYEVIHNEFVVEPKPVHGAYQTDAVGAGLVGCQEASPSDREIDLTRRRPKGSWLRMEWLNVY